ncbi:hypothetical protein SADO_02425 [Salinisphaera dokdonensis CL-ES53]|uniref:DUF72 domain-containing protein n=1 Tax=Salinisphaera dokdonensis CL-ES53 TaxID=1304272 RepID=A0ABV2AY79_9GAMM
MSSHPADPPPQSGSLFPEDDTKLSGVAPATFDASIVDLAQRMPSGLRLGTSSWYFPGWAGLVWDRLYSEKQLSRDGLAAYAQHPLFGAVGLDRGFYRPLTVSQYAAYADDVPDDFRFVVKAPSLVTDALVREPGGQGKQANPYFLDGDLAWSQFVAPAFEGLGDKVGALVFQISPLPRPRLGQIDTLIERLHALLRVVSEARSRSPDAVIAVEVRNPEWLTPAFVDALKDAGATYCLGLHPKMPPIDAQLPILRRLWPGPFVCRWNLNIKHGAFGYERARDRYSPFDKLIDPDPDTRATLARVIAGTVGAGQPAFVTVNNKAEGSSPLSVRALAEAVSALRN